MIETLVKLLSRMSYPRLTLLTVVGVALLVIGGTLALFDSAMGSNFDVLGFRMGVIGYLILLLAVSGYISIAVFKRLEEQ